ncbi:hypothetical protein C8A05DRAFT_44435 [Staphylotrichum tortipilum]|uniref:RING-type domain-containing protein n=1 Tax=Staphylotrichum tortipilum TaxID=2831512 RepID=A0AAN6MKU5_9PEZI|nr:hypothetical protein C8A05DRAFT_44435 [Staphylotrichum longicolle]
MSSSARRRSVRPSDLTMPAAPAPVRPASRSSTNRPSSRSGGASRAENPPAPKRKREPELDDDADDLFGDAPFARDIVDLVDVDEVAPAPKSSSPPEKPKASDSRVRLRRFDCVICMDKVQDLTITHCGHLFCSECLHSALQMDRTRRVCPICRQKIDKPSAEGRPGQKPFTQKAKGYYPLELKFTTKKALGKKPRGRGGGGGGGVSGIV